MLAFSASMRVSGADAHATQLSMLAAGLALAHQVAAKSLREGLFLATFSVAELPKMMLGASLFAIPMALVVARLMSHFGPGRLTPVMFVGSAFTSLLEWWLLPALPKLVAIALYLHVSIGGALLVSAFWSIVNERFDPHTLKNVVGRIGGSSTLGGLLGGLSMERAAGMLSPRSSLLVIGALALGAAGCTQRLGATLSSAKLPAEEPGKSRERLTGYLRTLALLVACTAAVSAFGDFALKQAAVARFSSIGNLVRFFAIFYTAASLVSFLLQILVSQRLLAVTGIGGTLSVPPMMGVVFGAMSLLSPSLISIGALRGADLALGPSLYRTAFEPLFTPVAAHSKRRAKALIDVVFDKGGEMLASLLIIGVLMGGPLFVRAPLGLVIFFSGIAVLLSFRAQRGYVVELEASLRAGAIKEPTPELEHQRRQLLSANTPGIDRQKLSAQIARLPQPMAGAVPGENDAASPQVVEQLIGDVRALLTSDANRIREVLVRPDLDPRLAAFVVPHLGRDDLVKAAVQALRNMDHGALGVLAESMHSALLPNAVRRRIPHVLRSLRGDRVVRSLFWALSADSIDVRYRAALALAEVTRDDRDLIPNREQVFGLVLTEVARGPLAHTAIDHVFALLALVLNRGALELARRGVLSVDRKLRGTALEYLESLLPEAVRSPLVSALAELAGPRDPTAVKQPDAELLEELRRSFRADLSPPSLAIEPD